MNSPDVLRVPRENKKGYYASCLSGGINVNANIGGLAINSPDVSKISIPGDVTNPLQGSPLDQPEINLSGSGGQNLDEMIDNPMEMDMMEGEEDQDDDPEILEEIEKRQEEIIEQFMEMSYTIKDEARETCMQQFEDDDDLPAKLKEINKENDLKRKNGLKELKKKLNDIIMDEELHCSAKLQKLYEDNEITEFI